MLSHMVSSLNTILEISFNGMEIMEKFISTKANFLTMLHNKTLQMLALLDLELMTP